MEFILNSDYKLSENSSSKASLKSLRLALDISLCNHQKQLVSLLANVIPQDSQFSSMAYSM